MPGRRAQKRLEIMVELQAAGLTQYQRKSGEAGQVEAVMEDQRRLQSTVGEKQVAIQARQVRCKRGHENTSVSGNLAPYPLAAPASVVPGGTSAKAHAVDWRQVGAQALPALTAVFRQPQTAGGRAHGQALAAVIHRQAMAVDQVICWRRGQPVVEHTEA